MPTTEEFERILRGAALRVTKPRVAVLSAVYANPHADTDSILGHVRGALGAVSHQAVYDVLRALTAAGLVRRIQPSGSVARYESRVADNHHHVVCRSCGTIADADCAVGSAPCLHASDDHGFTIDEAEVVYWGLCPDCSRSAVAAVAASAVSALISADAETEPGSQSESGAEFKSEPESDSLPNSRSSALDPSV